MAFIRETRPLISFLKPNLEATSPIGATKRRAAEYVEPEL
jgi:hypothetical protein